MGLEQLPRDIAAIDDPPYAEMLSLKSWALEFFMMCLLPTKMRNLVGEKISPAFDSHLDNQIAINLLYPFLDDYMPLSSTSTTYLYPSNISSWMKVSFYSKCTLIILQSSGYTCLFCAFSIDKRVI